MASSLSKLSQIEVVKKYNFTLKNPHLKFI
jgi:hypothetical protein